MIKRLTVKNFKCFDDETIEFAPVTTFIGLNYQGKSTIGFKALRLVAMSLDWKAEWIRYDQDDAFIEMELDTGLIVRRSRTKTGQFVNITHPDGTKESYVGINDCKDRISELTGIGKVALDDVDKLINLNFVPSKSPRFILGKRADGVQRLVVGILKFNEIDSARVRVRKTLGHLETRASDLNSHLVRLKTREAAVSATLEEIVNIDRALYNITNRAEDKQQRIDTLKELENLSHTNSITQEGIDLSLSYLEKSEKVSELLAKKAFVSEIQQTTQLLQKIEECESELSGYQEALNIHQNLHIKMLHLTTMRSTEAHLDGLHEGVIILESEHSRLERKRADYLLDLGICPTCQRKLT